MEVQDVEVDGAFWVESIFGSRMELEKHMKLEDIVG